MCDINIRHIFWAYNVLAPGTVRRRFQLLLIKPSHYDDDGYVIQWARSAIPSNTLAALYGLARRCAARRVLGPDVDIDIAAHRRDQHARPGPKRIARAVRARHGGCGMVGLVGVQTNQFPRALDLARPFRAAGVPVVIGGFHVRAASRCCRTLPAELKEALDVGITLFAGEAEEAGSRLLHDAATGRAAADLQLHERPAGARSQRRRRTCLPQHPPHCRAHAELRRRSRLPVPMQLLHHHQCAGPQVAAPCAGRRRALIRAHHAQGIRQFFITDDNFARNKDWEAIFDRIIAFRERRGSTLRLMIQVDTLCHKIPNFIEKAARAGVARVFIGLENINPANLLGGEEAPEQDHRIPHHAAGLEEGRRRHLCRLHPRVSRTTRRNRSCEDIEIIKKELPLDVLEFFILTPLPGSEDHKVLWQKGVAMEPDMNEYDRSTRSRRTRACRTRNGRRSTAAPGRPITRRSISRRVLRRTAATGGNLASVLGILMIYSCFVAVEKVSPLQGGLFRLKFRRDRRPGMPLEPVWAFYPKYAWDIVGKHARLAAHWMRLELLRQRIRRDPNRKTYMDVALTEHEDGELDLLTHSKDARTEVEHTRKVFELTAAAR